MSKGPFKKENIMRSEGVGVNREGRKGLSGLN